MSDVKAPQKINSPVRWEVYLRKKSCMLHFLTENFFFLVEKNPEYMNYFKTNIRCGISLEPFPGCGTNVRKIVCFLNC